MKKRYLLLLLILLSIASLFIGIRDIDPIDLLHLTDDQIQTLFISRFPRLISIIVAGISLSISGLIMQHLSRNKFVSPTTAGTDDAARLGILVAILMIPAASPLEKMVLAFLFALVGTFLFMKILEKVKYKDAIFIPLVGLMFGNVVGSATTFFAYKHNLIQNIASWLQGDFSAIMKGRYELIYISIPLVIVTYFYANRFTVAGLGEEFSQNLGLNYQHVMNVGLILVALISSVALLTVGMIPFLGLIIPNIVTLYQGDNLQKSLFHTAILGAIFVLACDILGRLIIYPYEIPIGLTVGVLGSGIFLYLLMRGRAYESEK